MKVYKHDLLSADHTSIQGTHGTPHYYYFFFFIIIVLFYLAVSRDLQSLLHLLLSCATVLASLQLIPLPAITILMCSSHVCLGLPTAFHLVLLLQKLSVLFSHPPPRPILNTCPAHLSCDSFISICSGGIPRFTPHTWLRILVM
jgi:hypothetical protein